MTGGEGGGASCPSGSTLRRQEEEEEREWAGTGAHSCLTPAANGRACRGRPKTAGPSRASALSLDIYSAVPDFESSSSSYGADSQTLL